jgi:hypothetical protein
MVQGSAGFISLKNKFLEIINARIKEGELVGTPIREFIHDVRFEDQLSEVEKSARKSFKYITTNLWKIVRFKEIVICWLIFTILQSYGV